MSSLYYSMGRAGSSRSKNSREKLLENRSCMLRIGERLMRAGSEGTLVQRPILAQNQNQTQNQHQNQNKASANGLAQSKPASLEDPGRHTENFSKDPPLSKHCQPGLGNSTPGVTSTVDSSTELLLQRKQHINSSLLCDPELSSCRTAPCSPNTARRSCAAASGTSSADRQLDSLMIQRLIDRKKEMCRDHLKNKYPQHVALIMGNQDCTTKQLSKEVLYGSQSTLHNVSSSNRSTRHGLQGSMSPPMVRSMPSSPSRMAYGGRSTRGVTGLVDQGTSTLPWDRQSGTRRPSLICTNSCSILERRDIMPDEDVANSKSTALVPRGEGGPCYPESYCSSMPDRGGVFLTSSQCGADGGIGGPLQQCHTAMEHQTHSLHSERMKAIEEQIANLTELVHHAVVMAPGIKDSDSTMAGHRPFVNRSGMSSKPHNTTAMEDSFACTTLALPTSPRDLRLQQSLMSAQRKVNELRLQLSHLRRLQLLNQNSVSSMLRMAGDELVVLMCTHLAQSEAATSRKRVEMEEGRLHYLAAEERILKQLSQLEDNVDCWQRNSASCPGQLSLTLRDVEEGAVNLQRVGEAVAVLKGEFTDLQAKMCTLLRQEVEAVRFLKEGPHRMDSMLKRVKALTEAIISLRRSVAESTSKPLTKPLKDMEKSTRCPTMQHPPSTSALMSSVSENQPEATKTQTLECSENMESSDMNHSLTSQATMPTQGKCSQSHPIANKHVDQVLPEAQGSLKTSEWKELDPSDSASGQKTSTASVSEQDAPPNLTLEAPPQLEKHQDQEEKNNPTVSPQQRSHAPSPGVGAGMSGRKEPIGAQPKPPRRPPEVKPKPQLRVPPAGFISTPAVASAQRDNREGEEGNQTFMTELQDNSSGSETAEGSNHSVTAPREVPALCHIPGKLPSSSLPTPHLSDSTDGLQTSSDRPTAQSPPSTTSAKWPPHASSSQSSGQKASLCSLASGSPSDPLRFTPSLTLTHLLPSSCQNTPPASSSASQHSSTSSSSSSSSSPSSSTSSTRSPTSSSSSPPSPAASSLLPTLVSGMSLQTPGSDPGSLRHSKTRSRVTGSQHVA